MFGLSLSKILQEAAITTEEGQTRYLSGGIESLDTLMLPDNQKKLEELHDGLYCFLAFYPDIDTSVSEYVKKGSLASDSGKEIMVLFVASHEMRSPQLIQTSDLVIQLDTNIHPAYEAVNILFPGKEVALPGIVFFDRFIEPRESVYIPFLERDSLNAIAGLCRDVFSIARATYKNSNETGRNFADDFSTELVSKRIRYERTGKTSFGEWLRKVYNAIKDNKSDIIAAVGLLK